MGSNQTMSDMMSCERYQENLRNLFIKLVVVAISTSYHHLTFKQYSMACFLLKQTTKTIVALGC
jgi:hypothetical protein